MAGICNVPHVQTYIVRINTDAKDVKGRDED